MLCALTRYVTDILTIRSDLVFRYPSHYFKLPVTGSNYLYTGEHVIQPLNLIDAGG